MEARQAHRVVLTPSTFLPPSLAISEQVFALAIDDAARAWSYPQLPCTSVEIVRGAPASRRLVGEDGINLVVFRSQSWCHNDRCGGPATFPLRAAAMTTVFPPGARGAEVREADVEINAVRAAWLEDQTPGRPTLRSVLLHEMGHLLGFPDLEPLPAGIPLDTVMREESVAEGLTERDVQATCERFPR